MTGCVGFFVVGYAREIAIPIAWMGFLLSWLQYPMKAIALPSAQLCQSNSCTDGGNSTSNKMHEAPNILEKDSNFGFMSLK